MHRTRTPAAVSTALPPETVGILLYLLAIALFAVMDAVSKHLSSGYPVAQVLFFRSIVALAALVPVVAWQRERAPLVTAAPWIQLLRGAMMVCTALFFYASLRGLGLAEATAITLAAPIFMVLLGILALGERVGVWRSTAVAVGFAGVIVIVQPGTDAFQPASLLALGAALSYAVASLLTRQLARLDPPLTTTFYGNLVMTVGGLLGLAWGWTTPGWPDLGLFLALGLTGCASNYLISVSFQHCSMVTVAPLEYLILVFAMGLGYLFWAEIPTAAMLTGAALIVAGSVTITVRSRRR